MAYRWLEELRSFIYPPTCLLCEAKGSDDLDLCKACADDLPRLENTCARCAAPIESPGIASCGGCQRRPPAFDATTALYHYRRPVDHLIQQLKFHGKLANARLLGNLLAKHLRARLTAPPACIIPVPLHIRRVRLRGYNQSLELADHVGRSLRVPVNHACVRRIRHTDPQMELPAKARRKNIRGAFEVANGFHAAHVALLDDVVTTGATVDELARMLKRAGVARVEIWSIARTG